MQVFFGILLPIAALGVELSSHICASAFFNPIPTIWHTLLIAYVILGNFMVMLSLASPHYEPRPRDAFIAGGVIAISLVYAARFLPVLPFSAFAILGFGFGLLPFAPLSALMVAIGHCLKLTGMKVDPRKDNRISRQILVGFLTGFLLLMLAELPPTLTKYALKRAASADLKESRSGILMLRSFGSKSELLRLCYGDRSDFLSMRSSMTDMYDHLLGLNVWVEPDVVRKIFYRVTGTPFNAHPKPSSGWDSWSDHFDSEVAGEVVGGRVPDLSLDSSEMQITTDPNAAVADVAWTLTFKNDAEYQNAEARTKIALPPGAVVSDLTLWINGVPKPAAFASKSTVRSAYQNVVQTMRDPVLVTTSGPDRILVQCFPVPTHGGTLKTKIQLAVPLAVEKAPSQC
jgi:hypothetical protein